MPDNIEKKTRDMIVALLMEPHVRRLDDKTKAFLTSVYAGDRITRKQFLAVLAIHADYIGKSPKRLEDMRRPRKKPRRRRRSQR